MVDKLRESVVATWARTGAKATTDRIEQATRHLTGGRVEVVRGTKAERVVHSTTHSREGLEKKQKRR
jgi:hypothetical protein